MEIKEIKTKEEIKSKIEELTGVDDIFIRSRKRIYVNCRAVYFKLCKVKNPTMTLYQIGQDLNFNHATVLNSINNTFTTLEKYEPYYYNIYKQILNGIIDKDNDIDSDYKLTDLINEYKKLDSDRKDMFILRASQTLNMIKKNKWN